MGADCVAVKVGVQFLVKALVFLSLVRYLLLDVHNLSLDSLIWFIAGQTLSQSEPLFLLEVLEALFWHFVAGESFELDVNPVLEILIIDQDFVANTLKLVDDWDQIFGI